MPWSTRLFSTEKEPGSLLPAKSTNLYLPLSAVGGGSRYVGGLIPQPPDGSWLLPAQE